MNDDTIPSRPLGSTGVSLTELTLGTWGLFGGAYGHVFPEQQTGTLEAAVTHGIRSFDMAPVWGDDGTCESAVAEAVGDLRNEFVYISRAGLVRGAAGLDRNFDSTSLRAQCEASLGRLKTDRLDVWLFHNPEEADLRREETRSLAEALLQEGKIRAWGASVSHLDDARAALEAGAQVLCLPFHMLHPRLLWDLEPDLRARKVGVLARSPLGHGLLAGRWSKRKKFTPDDHRSTRWSQDSLGERVEQLNARRFLLRAPILTMGQAAHRFVLAHDVVSSAVIGARTPGHVDASVRSIHPLPYLSDDDLARLRLMDD